MGTGVWIGQSGGFSLGVATCERNILTNWSRGPECGQGETSQSDGAVCYRAYETVATSSVGQLLNSSATNASKLNPAWWGLSAEESALPAIASVDHNVFDGPLEPANGTIRKLRPDISAHSIGGATDAMVAFERTPHSQWWNRTVLDCTSFISFVFLCFFLSFVCSSISFVYCRRPRAQLRRARRSDRHQRDGRHADWSRSPELAVRSSRDVRSRRLREDRSGNPGPCLWALRRARVRDFVPSHTGRPSAAERRERRDLQSRRLQSERVVVNGAARRWARPWRERRRGVPHRDDAPLHAARVGEYHCRDVGDAARKRAGRPSRRDDTSLRDEHGSRWLRLSPRRLRTLLFLFV